MAGIKDRLIQFILRGKDELSPAAKTSAEALEALTQEATELGQALDSAKEAQGLGRAMEQTGRAVAQARLNLEQTQQQVADLREALNQTPEAAGLQQSLKDAEREAGRARRQLNGLEKQLEDAEAAAKAAGVDTDKLADEQVRLAADVSRAQQALASNNEELKAAQRAHAAAARAAAEHTSRIDSARGAMTSGAKQVLAFAAAYVSLNAIMGLVGRGVGLVRDGIGQMLQTGDQFELLNKRMASLMGSVAAGEQATAWIKQFAKDTPLEVADVSEAFALLKSYGLDPMGGALQAIVDKNEQLGGGMERLQGISSALGQAYAKQKLQTEEILQLVERGVPVWGLLEKVTGKNAAQLAELATKGKLGRDVIQALIAEMGKSAQGAAADNMGTLTGLVSNLSDVWSDFLNRIAKSGALDYAKDQLQRVADTVEQMDKDGRLDKLAKSLAAAFEQGAEKVKEFAGRLVEVDFTKLIDDSSAWLTSFGAKIDEMATSVQLFVAPFRTLFNGITSGLSAMGAAFTGTWGLMLGAVEAVADKIPEAFGGPKIKAAISDAREVLNGLRDGFVEQIEKDGQDIRDAWDTTSQHGIDAQRQVADAAIAAEQAKQDAAKATVDKAAELNARFAQQAVDAAGAGARAIRDMADGLKLIETATTIQQLEGLRSALLAAYQAGSISQQEYAQATGVLNGRIKDLGTSAGGAAELVSDLEEKLGDLKSIQDAISNAKTDVDINSIRTALRKLYGDGEITARQYNDELKKTSDRQKELKQAVDEGKKAQDDKNESDEDAIVTSEKLRRESGKRMEAERRASGEAMELRRRGSEAAQADMEAVGDFFSGIATRAREPLAQLSEAALAAYDQLRGISTVDVQLDTSSLDATTRSLQQAREAMVQLQQASSTVGMSGFGRFQTEALLQSQQIQVQYLQQKARLQELMEGYESGSLQLAAFIDQASGARNSMSLLNDSDMRTLEGALEAARQRMQQLGDAGRSTLDGLRDELDRLHGNEEEIERRRFASRQRELQAQLAEARAGGNTTAAADLQEAVRMLRQLEDETTQKRITDNLQKTQQAPPAAAPAAAAPAQAGRVVRFESRRGAVDVQVASEQDETKLLGVLEDAGLRSM